MIRPILNARLDGAATVPSGASFTAASGSTVDLSAATVTLPGANSIARVTVATQAARYALTTTSVQNGDYVYQTDTAVLYEVTDQTALSGAGGYTALATVPLSQITGLGTNVGTFLATPSSANLAAAVTDETGSGLLVFNTSPSLISPSVRPSIISFGTILASAAASTDKTATFPNASGTVLLDAAIGVSVQAYDADLTTWAGITPGTNVGTFLATPSGANLASALTSALPVSKGGTGLTSGTSGGILAFTATGTIASSALLAANAIVIGGGAGVAPSTTTTGTGILTFLGTPSSANLAAAVTDETGSGALVFATSPTLVTPNLGTAIATSINSTVITGGGSIDFQGYDVFLGGTVTISNNFSTNDVFDINGNFVFPDANSFTGRTTGVTDITFPTSGTLAARITATATLNFGSTAAGAKSDLTMTLTGAVDGEAICLGVPNGSIVANGVFTAWVSAANTVTVRFTNTNLVTALDPASGTFTATIVR